MARWAGRDMFYLYFLQSEVSKKYYIGVASNVLIRLGEHNKGGTKSTKPYRPWKIVYIEKYLTKQEAMKREWHLKHPKGFLDKKSIISKLKANGEVA